MMDTIDFKEMQRFRILTAWIAVLVLHIFFIYAIVQQIIFKKPFGPKPAPDSVLLLVELGLIGLVVFFRSLKLKTRITANGIYFRFYPFQLKETFIEWHELKDAYMRDYNSFYEYGGWGIRVGSPKVGRAINTTVSSSRGLQLQFNDGRRLLIGTTRPDEIQAILDEVISKGKINRGG